MELKKRIRYPDVFNLGSACCACEMMKCLQANESAAPYTDSNFIYATGTGAPLPLGSQTSALRWEAG